MGKHKFYLTANNLYNRRVPLRHALATNGFTIVELLIVIVVIGILAALVLSAFSGAQAKARDTERINDIRVISSQLEVWYNANGYYPSTTKWLQNEGSGTYSQANAETWAQTNFPGMDINAVRAPGNAGQTMTAVVNLGTLPLAFNKDTYYYSPLNSAGNACTAVGTKCAGYNLYYGTEADSTERTKTSLNTP